MGGGISSVNNSNFNFIPSTSSPQPSSSTAVSSSTNLPDSYLLSSTSVVPPGLTIDHSAINPLSKTSTPVESVPLVNYPSNGSEEVFGDVPGISSFSELVSIDSNLYCCSFLFILLSLSSSLVILLTIVRNYSVFLFLFICFCFLLISYISINIIHYVIYLLINYFYLFHISNSVLLFQEHGNSNFSLDSITTPLAEKDATTFEPPKHDILGETLVIEPTHPSPVSTSNILSF